MRLTLIHWATSCLSLWIFFLAGTSSGAQPAVEQARAALEQMHAWLGEDDNARAWRSFLRSDQLLQQFGQAADADKRKVAEILQIYEGNAAGLDRPRFVTVRESLQAWMRILSLPKLDQLPAAVRGAKEGFVPIDAARVSQAKQTLRKAMDELDGLLTAAGSEIETGWKEYLRWQDVQARLQRDESPDLKVLNSAWGRYASAEKGLEMARFAEVRHALRQYIDTAAMAANPKAKEQFEGQLAALADGLEAHAQSPSPDQTHTIGLRVGWLQRAGQAADVVAAVRHYHWRTNLFAEASQDFLAAGIQREVDDTSDVEDYILGTSIYGTGHTVGQVTLELVPNGERAELQLRLQGTTHSNTTGYNGPVTIHSKGVTQVSARKLVWIDDHGIGSRAATAHCETENTIHDISARFGIIERMAWRRAGKMTGQAQQIASRHAEQRVARRVDADSQPQLDEANTSFQEKFRDPLLCRDAMPRQLRFSTSKDRLNVKALQAAAYQLAAPSRPPELMPGHDLAVRVHQTAINNLADITLGGETLTDEELAQLVKDLTGEVPEELKITEDKDPWSITFSRQQPFVATFAEESFSLAIRGRRFTRGDQPINRSIQISANYKMEKTPTGAKLTRQGDVEVTYLKIKGQLGVREVAFKTFLRKKFESLFKPEFITEGFVLKGRWEKAGKLTLRQMNSQQGWLTLGWNQATKVVQTAAAK